MVKCPHCGGEMEYLPGTEIIKCEYCDSEFSPLRFRSGKTAERDRTYGYRRTKK